MQKAEAMYRRALDGKEKAWGPEHTSTLNTVNNLGLFYADQGKMQEAEAMYRRALEGYEKAWGPEHTSTLTTVHNLGILHADQGRMCWYAGLTATSMSYSKLFLTARILFLLIVVISICRE